MWVKTAGGDMVNLDRAYALTAADSGDRWVINVQFDTDELTLAGDFGSEAEAQQAAAGLVARTGSVSG